MRTTLQRRCEDHCREDRPDDSERFHLFAGWDVDPHRAWLVHTYRGHQFALARLIPGQVALVSNLQLVHDRLGDLFDRAHDATICQFFAWASSRA